MKLTDREWGSFLLKDIFTDIDKGKRLIKEQRIDGQIPLLTAGENNQGVAGFISNKDMPIFKDFISIDMFGTAFYHDYQSSGDDNIHFFINDSLSRESKLFIVRMINKNKNKYSYGKQFRLGNAHRESIILPITPTLTPDWDFMEAYIREREEEKIEQYKAYAESVLAGLEYREVERLGEKEWGSFKIGDIFDVVTGRNIKKENLKNGLTPRITARDTQNGIDGYYNDQNISEYVTFNNIISISFLGSVKYHPYSVSLDMKIHALKRKDEKEFSPQLGLFLCNNLSREFIKYSYGNQLSSKDLLKAKVFLPITRKGEPDWEYMDIYTKNIMIGKYRLYFKI